MKPVARVLRSHDLALDLVGRTLSRGAEVHHLTPKESLLLETFLRNEGQVLTRQFLMKEVWETDYVADTRTLEVHVHWLRRKIRPEGKGPAYIHTVRGVGYVYRPPDEADGLRDEGAA